MHYYQHHTGDFRRDTAALDATERGVYVSLRDQYYATGQALPAHLPSLYRVCVALTPEERRAVRRVVKLYFEEHEGLYVHAAIEADLQAYRDHAAKSRVGGLRSGEARRVKRAEVGADAEGGMAKDQMPLAFPVGMVMPSKTTITRVAANGMAMGEKSGVQGKVVKQQSTPRGSVQRKKVAMQTQACALVATRCEPDGEPAAEGCEVITGMAAVDAASAPKVEAANVSVPIEALSLEMKPLYEAGEPNVNQKATNQKPESINQQPEYFSAAAEKGVSACEPAREGGLYVDRVVTPFSAAAERGDEVALEVGETGSQCGGRMQAASEATAAAVKTKRVDSAIADARLATLQSRYHWLDVRAEWMKCLTWCEAKGRVADEEMLVGWLNKAPQSTRGAVVAGGFDADGVCRGWGGQHQPWRSGNAVKEAATEAKPLVRDAGTRPGEGEESAGSGGGGRTLAMVTVLSATAATTTAALAGASHPLL